MKLEYVGKISIEGCLKLKFVGTILIECACGPGHACEVCWKDFDSVYRCLSCDGVMISHGLRSQSDS